MEKQVYLEELYDLYKELFTDKQKSYFEDYYFANLSYGEISENYQVSRAAVCKQIKLIEEKLLEYEEKLKLYEKEKIINLLISKTSGEIKNKLESLL
jgi:hypothetical protein